MNTPEILALALLLDAAVGEPRAIWDRVPHPAVLMGRAVGWADEMFNTGAAGRISGIAVLAVMVLAAGVIGAVLSELGWLPELLLAAVLLAQRSLVDHLGAVGDALRLSLGDGRRAVARIVSRDTSAMDGPAVARAGIESGAENLSDGVIAPAFWFLIAGLPGLLIYKLVNTADSMIGYRTPRHAEFGWAAARLDDLLNWVPARLTALLIAGVHGGLRGWRAIRADARLHRSPNAGWPEAAMARVLGIALAGPRSYDGAMRDYPFVNPHGAHEIGPEAVDAAVRALWRVWGAALAFALILAVF
ncbi:adenosylcobinamide-phosphate synthase [Salinihabitans flavidus]|uniref:Cobalamin biosynthesis protein CobD n=1 Tax=Salinihabitans flavidus TaxID=569882 RepID=A0A1H8UY20_9RHOB|nr:adenosylcobinamide-phosphate synthase CbiB [Salinihabitans flavidus]SEP07877.1 adenosylcobinamide-phosphate synthase [Salinihabitans flavidus]